MRRPQHDTYGRGKEEDMDVTTEDAYSGTERAIVAALTRMRPQGPDPERTARIKDRLMLVLSATPTERPDAASIAS